ncbi:helix-turn-helix domain-containing protein [Endozoicomonas atrinae]|uniref:helix-turn-helix domain-containing protein n=1 Tax=Endozoicomonas atrinae TaxID=1333660 RepID=UPI003B00C02A
MDKPTPGEVIRTYRESRGITLTSMSRVLYCSKSELSLFENNRKPIGKLRRLLWSTIIPEWTPDMLTHEGQKPCNDWQ